MTEKDMIIQEQRREIAKLKAELEQLQKNYDQMRIQNEMLMEITTTKKGEKNEHSI